MSWGPSKQREILAALLVHPGTRVELNALAEWIWESDREGPRHQASTFRTYAGRIGKALRAAGAPAKLQTMDGALHLTVERHTIDYFAFGDLIKKAHGHSRCRDHEAACDVITQALSLWRGRPLADLTSQRAQDWRHAVIHHEWLPANQLLLAELVALGRYDTALHKLDALQREYRTDIGLAKRRLQVLHALDRTLEMSGYHLDVRRLLKDSDEHDAAEDLRRYHDSLIATPEPIPAPPPTEAGARGAAERLTRVPSPRSPAERHSDRPSSLLPITTPRRLCSLPPGVTDFVGHTDLQDILDHLARSPNGDFRPAVVVLDGMAGIGKTTLALHWAHQQLGKLADNALYVDLHGFDGARPSETSDVVDELLEAFDIPIARFPTPGRRETKLREILTGTRTLIVLDNATNSAHVRPLLRTLSPCLVLVTSRLQLTGLAGRHSARHCTVTPLSPAHAAEVLTNRIGSRATADHDAVLRLTALCGGLPLALQLVAHHIEARRGAALTQFADELRDQSRLLDIGNDADDPHMNMRAALSVTFDSLPNQARVLFRLLGCAPMPELSLHAAAALAGRSTKDVQRILDVLISTHFLIHSEKVDRYRIHDLVRAFARDIFDGADIEDNQGPDRRLLSFYLHTSYKADRTLFPFRPAVPMLPLEPLVSPLSFPSQEGAQRWLLDERGNHLEVIAWATRNDYHEYTWRIPHTLYGLYRRYGYNNELRDAYTACISSTQIVRDLESEGASRSDLGLIHVALGDWLLAAQEFHLAAAIAQQTRSPMGIAISLLNLGVHEARMEHWDAATELYQRALDHATVTGDPGAISAILHRLAQTSNARGQHSDAIGLYKQALRQRVAIDNLHGQADTLTELAAIFSEQGILDEAGRHAEQSLTIIERIHDTEVGPRACYVMATIVFKQEKYHDAVGYARQAARLARRNHNSETEAGAFHILGHAHHHLGNLSAAEEGWAHAMAIYADLGDHSRAHHVDEDLRSLTRIHTQPSQPDGSPQ